MERYATYYYAANRIYDFKWVDLNEEVGCNYVWNWAGSHFTDKKFICDSIQRPFGPLEIFHPMYDTCRSFFHASRPYDNIT